MTRRRVRRISHPFQAAALAAVLVMASSAAAHADDPLPRRGWLGAALAAGEGGVSVQQVFPGSTAEAGGLKAGDRIARVQGQDVAALPEFLKTVRALRVGQELRLGIERDGQSQDLALTMKEWPREPGSDRYTVDYASVPSQGGRLRTITLAPTVKDPARKRPAVLIVQGLSAATLDYPKPGEAVETPTGMGVYRTIAARLADAGYVVARVDKAGCGDSQGESSRLDFNQELDGYRQALAALRSRGDVDPERVYVFGHSMGGVFGPVLAAEVPLRGLAVYGTALKTWLEYLTENTRRQAMLSGGDPVEVDTLARQTERFHHDLLVNHKSPAAILTENPDLKGAAGEVGLTSEDTIFGRHFTFFQQLHDVNLARAWKQAATNTLALWGEAEFVTSREDHDWIAAIVDSTRAGRGKMQVVTDSDHGFSRYDTPADAMKAHAAGPGGTPAPFNPAIIEHLLTWLDAVESSSTGS
jgi:alpha-beta hydrolase superfamily lysophospholipase